MEREGGKYYEKHSVPEIGLERLISGWEDYREHRDFSVFQFQVVEPLLETGSLDVNILACKTGMQNDEYCSLIREIRLIAPTSIVFDGDKSIDVDLFLLPVLLRGRTRISAFEAERIAFHLENSGFIDHREKICLSEFCLHKGAARSASPVEIRRMADLLARSFGADLQAIHQLVADLNDRYQDDDSERGFSFIPVSVIRIEELCDQDSMLDSLADDEAFALEDLGGADDYRLDKVGYLLRSDYPLSTAGEDYHEAASKFLDAVKRDGLLEGGILPPMPWDDALSVADSKMAGSVFSFQSV